MFGPYSGSPWIICDAATESYWLGQSLQAGTAVTVDTGAGPGFSKVQLVFTRTTPTGTREDVMVASLAFTTAVGSASSSLVNTDKAVVETALGVWWTAFKANLSNQITLSQFRWYDYQPITSRPGPVDRVTAVGTAGGAASSRLPDQVALTQTYKTASRKHWGRSYWPYPGSGNLDLTYGRVANALVTATQGYTRTLLQVSGGSGAIQPCVASIGYKAVLGIRELQTDNIADVVRRRRAKIASLYATNTS